MMPRDDSTFDVVRSFGGVKGFAECCADCEAVRVWAIGPIPSGLFRTHGPQPTSTDWQQFVAWVQTARAAGNATPWAPFGARALCGRCRTDEIEQQNRGFHAAIGTAVAPSLEKIAGGRLGVMRGSAAFGEEGLLEVSSRESGEFRIVEFGEHGGRGRLYTWRSGIGFGVQRDVECRGDGMARFWADLGGE